MKIYLSGVVGSGVKGEQKVMAKISPRERYRCFTFFYLYPALLAKKTNRYLDSFNWSLENGVGIMMDSGAHSIQKLYGELGGKKFRGKSQTLEQFTEEMFLAYCDFCKSIHGRVDFYVTFDYRSTVDVTWQMTERMRKMGLLPVPVFHGDTNVHWLGKYSRVGHPYLGISGVITTHKGRSSKRTQMEYLDSCFGYLKEKQISVRTHGFAVTRMELMANYPWTSVDSSTWLQTAAYGSICLLNSRTRRMEILRTSKMKSDTSYWRLPREQQKYYDRIFEERGTDIEKLSQEATPGLEERMTFNAQSFALYQAPCREYKPRFQGLF